jgi:hypothetical protein
MEEARKRLRKKHHSRRIPWLAIKLREKSQSQQGGKSDPPLARCQPSHPTGDFSTVTH